MIFSTASLGILHRHDQTLDVLSGERSRLFAARRHPDGNLVGRWAVQLCLATLVVRPLEVEFFSRQQPVHDLEGLPHPSDPLRVTGELESEGSFVDVLPGPDAQDEPPIRKPVDGRRRLGNEGRVIVKQRARHRRGEHEPLGLGCSRPQPGPHEPGGRIVVDPWMEMVGGRDHVEPDLLRKQGLVDQGLGLIGLV